MPDSTMKSAARWKLTLGAVMVAALSVTGVSTAQAAPVDEATPPPGAPVSEGAAPVDPAVVAEYEEMIAPLFAATETGATPTFDADAAAAGGATPQEIADWATAVEAGGGQVSGSVTVVASEATARVAAAAASCSGTNGFTGYFPSGPQWALDSCNTAKLISSVGVGAAGTTVVAGILALAGAPHAGAVAGVVAAIIGLGAAFLVACEAWSSNSAIYLNGGQPGILPPSCWGQ